MKTFICGLCKKKGIRIKTTRKGLRKHLREEHFYKKRLTNLSGGRERSTPAVKQSWWITEEVL